MLYLYTEWTHLQVRPSLEVLGCNSYESSTGNNVRALWEDLRQGDTACILSGCTCFCCESWWLTRKKMSVCVIV